MPQRNEAMKGTAEKSRELVRRLWHTPHFILMDVASWTEKNTVGTPQDQGSKS